VPDHNSQPTPERRQTDDSLRAERDRADRAVAETLDQLEEAADAVISKAQVRADELLAAARERTDRGLAGASPRASLARERKAEDAAVREDRALAEDKLRQERTRAHGGAALARDRGETDRDLLGERARSDHALAARDVFLGIVSHDLRNQLNVIVGYSALMVEESSVDDRVARLRQHAERIQRSAARMSRLIGDLVDVASIEAGMLAVAREESDPAEVVREAVDTLGAHARAMGVAIEEEVASTPPAASFDPARILQVLVNLLGNAIKFTPAGGKVTVRLERLRDDIHIAVSDTGAGIPTDKLEVVFDRFVQVDASDRRGVGLGLYISRCIVNGHGGRIWAESRPGVGSTFHFTLPL
jgi:signal transduction histidine kinase